MTSILGMDVAGYAQGAFPPRVEWKNRKSNIAELACLGIFLLMVAAYIGTTIYLDQNSIDLIGLIKGTADANTLAYNEKAKSLGCFGNTTNGRLLLPNGRYLADNADGCADMFCVMSKSAEVPVVIIGVVSNIYLYMYKKLTL